MRYMLASIPTARTAPMRFFQRSALLLSHAHPVQTVSHIRSYHASVLPSRVSPISPDFRAKSDAMDVLVADLEAKLAVSRQGGGGKARLKMKEKGKLLPRERYVGYPCR